MAGGPHALWTEEKTSCGDNMIEMLLVSLLQGCSLAGAFLIQNGTLHSVMAERDKIAALRLMPHMDVSGVSSTKKHCACSACVDSMHA